MTQRETKKQYPLPASPQERWRMDRGRHAAAARAFLLLRVDPGVAVAAMGGEMGSLRDNVIFPAPDILA